MRKSAKVFDLDFIPLDLLPTVTFGQIHIERLNSTKDQQDIGISTLSTTYTVCMKAIQLGIFWIVVSVISSFLKCIWVTLERFTCHKYILVVEDILFWLLFLTLPLNYLIQNWFLIMTNFFFEIDNLASSSSSSSSRNLMTGQSLQLIISSVIILFLNLLLLISFIIMICWWKNIKEKSYLFSLWIGLSSRRWIVIIHYLHFFVFRIIILVLVVCYKEYSMIKWMIVFVF